MPLQLRKFTLVALLTTVPSLSFGQDCSLSRLWEKGNKKGSSTKVLILPFRTPKGADNGPARVLTVLLKEYLSHGKRLSLLPIPPQTATSAEEAVKKGREMGADRVITGQLSPEGNGYRVESLLLSASDGKEILRFEGSFEFSNTMNDLLLKFAEESSAALKSRIEEKKLLPYLNLSTSPAAYLSFADGSLALEESLEVGAQHAVPLLQKAVLSFEQAIQKDYNYVPAYLGLAEASAGLSALARTTIVNEGRSPSGVNDHPSGKTDGGAGGRAVSPPDVKSRLEMEKAKLLNPVLTKVKEPRIERYLKAQKQDLCGGEI